MADANTEQRGFGQVLMDAGTILATRAQRNPLEERRRLRQREAAALSDADARKKKIQAEFTVDFVQAEMEKGKALEEIIQDNPWALGGIEYMTGQEGALPVMAPSSQDVDLKSTPGKVVGDAGKLELQAQALREQGDVERAQILEDRADQLLSTLEDRDEDTRHVLGPNQTLFNAKGEMIARGRPAAVTSTGRVANPEDVEVHELTDEGMRYRGTFDRRSAEFQQFRGDSRFRTFRPTSARVSSSRTDADGNVITSEGPINAEQLTTRIRGVVQEDIMNMRNRRVRLERIQKRFKREYLEIGPKLWREGLRFTDKAGLALPEKEKRTLREAKKFFADAYNDLSLYIKDITGAAMTVEEGKRIQKGIQDVQNDSPTEYKAALDDGIKQLKMAEFRAWRRLHLGIEKPAGEDPKLVSLGSIEGEFKSKASAYFKEAEALMSKPPRGKDLVEMRKAAVRKVLINDFHIPADQANAYIGGR